MALSPLSGKRRGCLSALWRNLCLLWNLKHLFSCFLSWCLSCSKGGTKGSFCPRDCNCSWRLHELPFNSFIPSIMNAQELTHYVILRAGQISIINCLWWSRTLMWNWELIGYDLNCSAKTNGLPRMLPWGASLSLEILKSLDSCWTPIGDIHGNDGSGDVDS